MDGDNTIGLERCDPPQEAVVNKRRCDCLYSRPAAVFVAQTKDAPIHFGVIADGRPVEFDCFTQGKAAILFKDVDNFDAIGRRRHWRDISRGLLSSAGTSCRNILFPCMPYFLFLFGDRGDVIATCLRCTSMSGSSISIQEKHGSLA